MKATVRPNLCTKPGWASVLRFRPSPVIQPSLRQISSQRNRARTHIKSRRQVKKRPDRADHELPAVPLVHYPSGGSHDVVVALAELGALEQRIGYRFKDKLLGVSAFKISGSTVSVKFQGMSIPMEQNRRLALLGDRVLDLALCRTWYRSGQSLQQYTVKESALVTRLALAKRGLDINLERNVLGDHHILGRNALGELFEALVGAIYVDSQSNLDMVQRVLRNIGFEDVATTSGTKITANQQLKTQNQEPPYTMARPVPAGTPSSSTDVAKRDTHHSITEARELLYPKYAPGKKKRRRQFLGILAKYWSAYLYILDAFSWFPSLKARYARILPAFPSHFETPMLRAKIRARTIVEGSFFTNETKVSIDQCGKMVDKMLKRKLYKAKLVESEEPVSLSHGNVFDWVRRSSKLSHRLALLTAHRIEEEMRASLRRSQGLPDWYDLPENKDKVRPPWRRLPSLHFHPRIVIPMEIQPQREVTVRPPLLLDTTRHLGPDSDALPSGVEQLTEGPSYYSSITKKGRHRRFPLPLTRISHGVSCQGEQVSNYLYGCLESPLLAGYHVDRDSNTVDHSPTSDQIDRSSPTDQTPGEDVSDATCTNPESVFASILSLSQSPIPRPSARLHSSFHPQPSARPPKMAFRPKSVIMPRNKVWFQDQQSGAAPGFTSFCATEQSKATTPASTEEQDTVPTSAAGEEERRG